jgi:SAM-dependent methyltransferase
MYYYYSKKIAIACLCCAAVFMLVCIKQYIQDGSRRWFADEFEHSSRLAEVQNWTEKEKNANLYKLSKWGEFTPVQFEQFVALQIRGLHLQPNASFFFLEVGMGVGAFARRILQLFPNANGYGFDIEPRAIAVASHSQPKARMVVAVGDMLQHLQQFADAYFDVIFVPGSLCYLQSLDEVETVLRSLSRILKGGMCLSMLASGNSPMGSCNTRIPKRVFVKNKWGLRLVSLDEMDLWELPHASGRYAVCLTKI